MHACHQALQISASSGLCIWFWDCASGCDAPRQAITSSHRSGGNYEVEQLHVRIGALELANAALSGRLSLRETEMTRLNSISAAKFAGDSLLSGLLSLL